MFHSAAHEVYLDLGPFGTGVMFSKDAGPRGLKFLSRPLSECYWSENAEGEIDRLYREGRYTARQAIQEFGADAVGPNIIKKAQAKGGESQEVCILHCVQPRGEKFSPLGDNVYKLNKPFASVYIDVEGKHVIREGGFDSFPYHVPRWEKRSGEVYGSGPALNALADIRMINAMSETLIRAAQKMVDPPLMVPDDGFLGPVKTRPSGLNYYRANTLGKDDRITPIPTGGQPNLALELLQARQAIIRKAFHVDWLNMPDSGPQMTATEALQRRDEKLRLLGPVLGRMQTEFLGPVVARAFAIGLKNGWFRPPPASLQGRALRVEFVSPIAQAQKLADAEGMIRVLTLAGQLAQFDPDAVAGIDADETLRIATRLYGAPAKMLRGQQEMEQMRQAMRQQKQMAAGAQIAEQAMGAGQKGAAALAALSQAQQVQNGQAAAA
jgi:hypothetical protein